MDDSGKIQGLDEVYIRAYGKRGTCRGPRLVFCILNNRIQDIRTYSKAELCKPNLDVYLFIQEKLHTSSYISSHPFQARITIQTVSYVGFRDDSAINQFGHRPVRT